MSRKSSGARALEDLMRLLLAVLLALAIPSSAAAQIPIGGFSSDGVEFVGNFARHADTAGGRLLEGHYYVTTERDLSIYDVKDPESPVLVGNTLLETPGQPVFTEEDPDTNGRILLVSNSDLQVYDVSDKAAPTLLANLPGFDEHTVSCVLDCTWAYGSEGGIVDLRDPANPRLSDARWNEATDSTHDVTEVSPGILLTSTEPMLLLDARANPEAPVQLAEARTPGFAHANLWPHGGLDDFALVGGEDVGPGCSESASASFMVWDTRGWQTSKTFALVDEFRMSTGVPPDGASPESTYCVHWFDPHPTYANGGLVAISWYEHGVRFLQVGGDGTLAEVGWYVPLAGQSSDVDWISDRVVYVADYLRGVDILRFTGDIPQGRGLSQAAPPSAPPGSAPGTPASPRAVSFSDLVRLPSARRCARSLRIRVRKAADPVKSLTVRVNGKKARRVRGRALRRPVRLKRLPRGKRFSIVVEVRTRSGHRTAGQRTYRGCR